MRSNSADQKVWAKDPFEDLDLLKYLIADLKSEKTSNTRYTAA